MKQSRKTARFMVLENKGTYGDASRGAIRHANNMHYASKLIVRANKLRARNAYRIAAGLPPLKA